MAERSSVPAARAAVDAQSAGTCWQFLALRQCRLGIRWDDPAFAIAWPDLGVPYAVSAKDQAARMLEVALPKR